jgi:hypothetical protein
VLGHVRKKWKGGEKGWSVRGQGENTQK